MKPDLFTVAIVKGLVENGDGTYYFGSTGSFRTHEAKARSLGLVATRGTITPAGRRWYADAGLSGLNKCSRATAWLSKEEQVILHRAYALMEKK